MSDLLNIGSAGIYANQSLLDTTSNNIANVNSEGYNRQETRFATNEMGDVNRGETGRVVDELVQAELWRNSSAVGYTDVYKEQADSLDKFLSADSISLGTKLDSLYSSLHSINDSPTDLSTRDYAISQFKALDERLDLIDAQYVKQEDYVNEYITENIDKVNDLVDTVHRTNQLIDRGTESQKKQGGLEGLYDERDEAIRQLSEKIGIYTLDAANGSKQVFLSNGEALVSEGQARSLKVSPKSEDPTSLELTIIGSGEEDKVLDPTKLKGMIGGLYSFRSEVLDQSRNQLGQLTVALADAMNNTNNSGMDLNGDLGEDIFSLPTFEGLPNKFNTGNGKISGEFAKGQGNLVTAYDYKISFTDANGSYEIQRYKGSEKIDNPVTGTLTAGQPINIDGLNLTPDTGSFSQDDSFYFQPTKTASSLTNVIMNQPEKLAIASALKVDKGSNNVGNATVEIASITDTKLLNDQTQTLDPTAPTYIRYENDEYVVYDGSEPTPQKLGSAPTSTNGQNILANAVDGTGQPLADFGYDININGEPTAGDFFQIGFNKNGFEDNSNGLRLAQLGEAEVLSMGTAEVKSSIDDGYNNLLTFVGGKTSDIRINNEASKTLLEQTTELNDSKSAVNLDEEAADLVRYQQAYAASSQVVKAAQSTFDSILSAVG